jgi:hypothetical protein
VARLAALAALLAVLAAPAAARAQSLQRLTVTQFTFSASTYAPALEVPFHLIITVHVKERISDLNYLDLPVLAQLELLGDERRLASSAQGTTYTETIEAVAHHTGTITIAPATLDAVDPRDNKAKQYSSNTLVLHVTGGALKPFANPVPDLARVQHALARLFLTLVTVAALVAVVVLFFRRAPRRPGPQPAYLPPPVPVRDPRDRLRDALATLRVEQTRATAMKVRALVRAMVGAGEKETLGDVLRRPLAAEPGMRDLLVALERATFTYESDLRAAIDVAIARLERMT